MTGPASVERSAPRAAEPCADCGAPLADDQRYCLQCGEVRGGARRPLPGLLRGAIGERDEQPAASPGMNERWPRLTATLAGLACLLLAMGVGVLIGRGGGADEPAPAPITIAGAAGAPSATAVAFTGDWPSGKDGWTVALEVLPKASTQPAAVATAKATAAGKGATAVGALDSDAYPTLTAGSYVVYAGVFDDEQAATAALARLRASFAQARVVHVAATAAAAPTSTTAAGEGAKSTPSAPRSSKSGGAAGAADDTKKAFEESKKAPKTVGTGGNPPPTDDKPAAGGGGFEEIG